MGETAPCLLFLRRLPLSFLLLPLSMQDLDLVVETLLQFILRQCQSLLQHRHILLAKKNKTWSIESLKHGFPYVEKMKKKQKQHNYYKYSFEAAYWSVKRVVLELAPGLDTHLSEDFKLVDNVL